MSFIIFKINISSITIKSPSDYTLNMIGKSKKKKRKRKTLECFFTVILTNSELLKYFIQTFSTPEKASKIKTEYKFSIRIFKVLF